MVIIMMIVRCVGDIIGVTVISSRMMVSIISLFLIILSMIVVCIFVTKIIIVFINRI